MPVKYLPAPVAEAKWGGINGNIDDQTDLIIKLNELSSEDHNHDGIYEPRDPEIQDHLADVNNPHSVNKHDVGLANVLNEEQLTAAQLESSISGAADKVPSSQAVSDYAAPISHTADTGNPHQVSKEQAGLGNVTNDAQLKRADGDFNSFTAKSAPVDEDILLGEDSEDSFSKKKLALSAIIAKVKKTYRISHTYAVMGELKAESSDDDYIPPFIPDVPPGSAVSLIGANYKLKAGIAGLTVLINGSPVSGLDSLQANTALNSAAPVTAVQAGSGDEIRLRVDAVSNLPKGLSFSLQMDYEA
ncbi:MAG: hypothetical protein ACLFQU_05020 [Candidatus Kapaibacterium sp.]